MTDHGVLKRLLLAYRAASAQLAAGNDPPLAAVVDAGRLIEDYIESFHEGLEEAYVFPRVRDELPDLVHTLLVQHDRGRHLTASIYSSGEVDLTRPDARAGLRGRLDAFVRMYEPHEAWEDTVVFPALRRASSQRELDLLAERFATLQTDRYGDQALTQLLDRVAEVEQQLGVADLASVTPPDEIA